MDQSTPDQPGAGAAAGGTPGTDPKRGLGSDEAARLLAQYGPNAIEEKHTSPLLKFLSFFWGPIPWMIEAAAILSAAVRHWEDFAIITIMLVINAVVGFWQEHQADNAIAALKKNLALKAHVLRDGTWRDIAARDLVPGDVILIRIGNVIPADVTLVEGDYLSVDQSALTGESLPVDKAAGDIAYSSSVAKMGEMKAIVTATGGATYFGRTAKLVETAGATSHFQKAVLRIGNFLILITLALVALILVVALFRHDPLVETVLFALILTVAAIPVALPAVLSVTMAVGAVKLAKMKAIVSRLVSIEEMAGMDILCSDKTGTLTKNELTLGDPIVLAGKAASDVVLAAALASQSDSPDAIDGAILKSLGDPAALKPFTISKFVPFDPVSKRAEADVEGEGGRFQVAKGAPQAILELVGADGTLGARVSEETDKMAAKGYRTLGVARTDPSGKWQYVGLLPLFDPPRDDALATIHEARSMGLDVRMVTGDHVAIAKEIAGKLDLGTRIIAADEAFDKDGNRRSGAGIEDADGYAQVFPEHKYRIVKELQGSGHIVGMTGDGVNDAPALKQADVGIAVSGATDAARAAADLILTGVGLSVITRAIEEARKIFERMNSYAVFRIAETVRVLLFMTLSILVFNFYPVTAVMIVLLAVLNDFPIMMIAYDNAPVARKPVKWDMHRVLTLSIILGVMGVFASFGLFWIAEEYLHLPRETIQTLVFLKLLVAGHLTIYLTRNTGAIWDRPWPSWKLIVVTETTQVLGTLAAVYGWLVEPIGWKYALGVWAYALIWFLINSVVKIYAYRLMRRGRDD
ncbi:MAG: plasma-membrane proton-efflux P-type ATPase [Bauldia sp.]|uniref:plasma-membrane proton-efflux P-type ATPase n=1 Tax=Bauldia sp. TaxID=2575872 RepID=UPI001DA95E4B|nr:plasma-membrane proton-efflux P-type ATPase [Bauldia sp.]MCB1495517.1 plasma-membrane proton-efflux P-type ATPase [Bauldia sp.]